MAGRRVPHGLRQAQSEIRRIRAGLKPQTNSLTWWTTWLLHPFWKVEGQVQQEQMIQLMKNLSMMGAMLSIVATGLGPMSLDTWLAKRTSAIAQGPAMLAPAG